MNIDDIDWNEMWNKKLEKMPKKDNKKMWNKIAPKFNEWMKKDDYPQIFSGKIHREPQFTVLDLGCGDGSITLELAKHVKEVTALDISQKMLDLIAKKAENEGIKNINYLKSTIEDLNPDQKEIYDVIIASRSLNGIYDLKNELRKINDLSRGYVYMTFWGASSNEFERDVCDFMDIEYHQHPDYIYPINMLYQLGIYANIEVLDNKKSPIYNNLEDAMERCMWRLGWNVDEIKSEDEIKLRNYLKENLIQKEDGTFDYPHNKPKWVLVWWKKDNL